jgi:hypothetical protein
MKTATESGVTTTVAASVAGEDVRCGDYVTVLNATYEVPSYMWDQAMLPANELVRLKFIPSDAGVPLKVFAVCLPFIYGKTATDDVRTLDLRRQQIVRLDRVAAKEVWGALKPKLK